MSDIIKSDKITLRPIDISDTENIIKWRNSDFVRRNFIYQEPFTYDEHLRWLNEKVSSGKVVQFIIVRNDTDTPIGSVYFKDINRKAKTAEYGIFIGDETALNKGYGSLVCNMASDYARDELKIKRLYLRLFEDNIAAYKSYINGGFKQIDEKEYYAFSKADNKEKKVIFMEKEV